MVLFFTAAESGTTTGVAAPTNSERSEVVESTNQTLPELSVAIPEGVVALLVV